MKPVYYVVSRTENEAFDIAGTIVKTMEVAVRGCRIVTKVDDPTHGLFTFGAEYDPTHKAPALILRLPFSEWENYPPGKKLRLAPLEE